jgi:hypothetical protein
MGTFTNELSIDFLAKVLSAVMSAQKDKEVIVTAVKKNTEEEK